MEDPRIRDLKSQSPRLANLIHHIIASHPFTPTPEQIAQRLRDLLNGDEHAALGSDALINYTYLAPSTREAILVAVDSVFGPAA